MYLTFCKKQYLEELGKNFLRFRKFFAVSKTFSKRKKKPGLYMHTDISRTANIYDTDVSLQEVTKPINSQTNNKFAMA